MNVFKNETKYIYKLFYFYFIFLFFIYTLKEYIFYTTWELDIKKK